MASFKKRNEKWQAQVRRTGMKPRAQSFIPKTNAQRWIRQTETELDRAALAFDPTRIERATVAALISMNRHEVTSSGFRGQATGGVPPVRLGMIDFARFGRVESLFFRPRRNSY